MEVKETLDIAIRSGEILLISGSEIYRVEDTIDRICSAYNVKCECFVTPPGIFVSGYDTNNNNEPITIIKRIRNRTINLHNIEIINSFSRDLQNSTVSYEEALLVLKGMETAPYFPFIRRFFSAGITAFAYAILLKGSLIDSALAAMISMLIYSIREKMNTVSFSQFFIDFICSFLAGMIAVIANKFSIFLHVESIIVGSIMILVPGLAITNGIRDAMHGDILSSQARLGEALLTVTAIGVGVGIALSLMKYWM